MCLDNAFLYCIYNCLNNTWRTKELLEMANLDFNKP